MANIVATRTIQKFRVDQFKGFKFNIRRFGPLNTETIPIASEGHVLPNPFIARKNVATGKWRPPAYSLRRQAELVKAAKVSGLLHLLPPGPKTPRQPLVLKQSTQNFKEPREGAKSMSASDSEKIQGGNDLQWLEPVAWEGKVKEKAHGADLGVTLYARKKRMFKGHKWERVQQDRKKKQAILLRDMKKRIFNYKNYYKRRKPDPLKPPRSLKAPKLPF